MIEDLFGFGETTGRPLRVDELPVHGDLEDTSGALDQLRNDTELFLQGGGQTGRLGEVVSNDAVLDRHAGKIGLLCGHGYLLSVSWIVSLFHFFSIQRDMS